MLTYCILCTNILHQIDDQFRDCSKIMFSPRFIRSQNLQLQALTTIYTTNIIIWYATGWYFNVGVRAHFPNLVKGLTDQSAGKAQLGLGHSYSRAKVKFNVNRVDNMIIQSISLLDQLDKNINTFAMRMRLVHLLFFFLSNPQ